VAASRFHRELAWMERLPGLGGTAVAVLAARVVGCMSLINPQEYGPQEPSDWCARLASARPERDALEAAVAALMADGSGDGAITAADLACVDALWPLAAPLEHLLASGGDDRLTLNPATGLNKYGCTPWPSPDVISFGSCTASSLSEGAFEAAERARRDLVASALDTSPASALAAASDAIADAVLKYFRVDDLAEAVLAASGTDAALVVTGLLAAERPGEALTSVLVSPSETGSGVPDAVQGRHFASCAASGSLVGKGEPIDGLAFGPALVTIALRDETGLPRSQGQVEADFEAAIRAGAAAGHVVLHAIDGSKTGLTAPDRDACRRLAQEYGAKLDIVIDACQARIEPALVRWYLLQGFPVLVTGSKFFSAPGFCGAVLFPRMRLQKITRAGRLPAGLSAYARLQGGFGSRRCPGLILRWTAALHEMAIFGCLPAQQIGATLDHMGRAIGAAISRDQRLKLVAAPRPSGMGWSEKPSVFTFAVQAGKGLMRMEELRRVYRDLQEDCSAKFARGDIRCQLGQPVLLGKHGLGGLRIAINSSQIASNLDQSDRLRLVLEKFGNVLDDTA
jgi:hypothetical protein